MAFPYFSGRNNSLSIGPFDRGIMIDIPKHEIGDANSPDMLNMIFENGILRKREGQRILFDKGDTEMKSCYKKIFNGYIVYCAGNRIRAYHIKSREYIIFDERIPEKKGCFFEYNGYLYYIGCGDYYKLIYEEGKLRLEKAEGYIPTVYINCDPGTGTGDDNESPNLLTGKYKSSFNTEVNTQYIYLPGNPDLTFGVTVEYKGRVLGADEYTLEPENCKVFLRFEPEKGYNSLVITACSKEGAEDRAKITGCNVMEIFGGSASGLSEGTRVFVSGNSKYKNTFFYSDLRNPEYFPLNNFDMLGDSSESITAFGKQGGGLVIFKERSIYISLYNYSSGEAVFTITNISEGMGCDCGNTVATADNRLFWFSKNFGVMTLLSTGKTNGNNVAVISANINGRNSKKRLLGKENYENVSSWIYKNRYHLCTDDYCYVLDTEKSVFQELSKSVWYIYSDIRGFFPVYGENITYFGGRKECFTYFDNMLFDFSEEIPIKAEYTTKAFPLGNPGYFKTVKDISLLIRADRNSYAEISCFDEDGLIKKCQPVKIDKFTFPGFKFSGFTFFDTSCALSIKRKLFRKRVKFFYLKIKNYEPVSDMVISALTVNFNVERGVKYNGI